jgi:hypothetical protein
VPNFSRPAGELRLKLLKVGLRREEEEDAMFV